MTRDTRSAFRARTAATERSIDEAVASVQAERDTRYREAREAARIREATRPRFTRDDLVNAVVVKDRLGWLKVVTVNQLTVTVEGDFGPRRIPFDRVYDYREAS